MSDFEFKDGKFVINGLEDINRFIAERFPKGLEAYRKKDFFNNGAYIGFNLCRSLLRRTGSRMPHCIASRAYKAPAASRLIRT